MAINFYGFIALTGGTSGALDEIDDMSDGDQAFGCVDGTFSTYSYDADSELTADGVNVVAPVSASGRWIKQESGGGGGADVLAVQVFS